MKTKKAVSLVSTVMVLIVFFSMSVSATMVPATFSATTGPGTSVTDSLNVQVSGSAPKADVLFIFDLTGSMGGVLSSAKAGATDIMNSFSSTDIRFGVESHMDYPASYSSAGYSDTYGAVGDYPYKLDLPFTAVKTDVQTAINGLSLGNGVDAPESYSRALYESYSDPAIAWRDGAKRIVVEFGDSIPHDVSLGTGIDPGRDGVISTSDDLNIDTVINGMKTNNIELLFDSLGDYTAQWNTWAAVTGGQAFTPTGDFVTLVTNAINAGLSVATVDNLHLQASAGYEAWLTGSDPASYSGATGVTVPFKATITVPSGTAPGTYKFTLTSIDSHGVSFGDQTVTVTVPGSTGTLKVKIDIEPGCCLNAINLRDCGNVKVAILATSTIDVKKIDRASITFGAKGTEAKVLTTCYMDVNCDHKLDLVCTFAVKKTGFKLGDTLGVLDGKMADGTAFTGSDRVCIVQSCCHR